MHIKIFFQIIPAIILLSGCSPKVKVEAPEKPITVNLNVNVEHKLKVKLDNELEDAIQSNPELF